MSDFQQKCTGCGICTEACPFLETYGLPDKILSERPDAVFFCTSCRLCDAPCPEHLSPSSAFFKTKEDLVAADRIPPEVRPALDGARAFVKTGHRWPFLFYRTAETVFWPGCGLAGNRPALVRKIRNLLQTQLKQKVGLILDCCFDPVFTMGDTQASQAAWTDISRRLQNGGVKKVVTGCLNCHKILSQHIKEIDVVFVLEMLPPDVFHPQEREVVYLHHPCPSAPWEGIRRTATQAADHLCQTPATGGQTSARQIENSEPLCCGAAGNLASLSPELADRFLDRITARAAGRKIVTYCTGCSNRFRKRGVNAVHLLDYLFAPDACKTMVSPVRQWANRLMLAMRERIHPSAILMALLLVLLAAAGVYAHAQHIFSADALTSLLKNHPTLAPVIFLCIYAVAPSLFLPSIPLALAAGFFWGPVWGVILAITGATIGSFPPFFLSRYLFQDAVRARVPDERWNWLQNKVNLHGWKAVAFTRLIPVFPFNLLNYLFGLTPIPFLSYFWSTLIFMLPGCIAFVAFGSSLGELILRGNIRGVLIGIGIALGAFLIPLALRPIFRKIVDDKNEKQEVENDG